MLLLVCTSIIGSPEYNRSLSLFSVTEDSKKIPPQLTTVYEPSIKNHTYLMECQMVMNFSNKLCVKKSRIKDKNMSSS